MEAEGIDRNLVHSVKGTCQHRHMKQHRAMWVLGRSDKGAIIDFAAAENNYCLVLWIDLDKEKSCPYDLLFPSQCLSQEPQAKKKYHLWIIDIREINYFTPGDSGQKSQNYESSPALPSVRGWAFSPLAQSPQSICFMAANMQGHISASVTFTQPVDKCQPTNLSGVFWLLRQLHSHPTDTISEGFINNQKNSLSAEINTRGQIVFVLLWQGMCLGCWCSSHNQIAAMCRCL